MKLLLDTQAFLQLSQDPQLLPQTARQAVLNTDNELFLSIVSTWEMQIKYSLGKLKLTDNPCSLVRFELEQGNLALINIELAHIEELSRLPSIHRDPFDRMLIAQAQSEKFTMVTADHRISLYPLEVLWI